MNTLCDWQDLQLQSKLFPENEGPGVHEAIKLREAHFWSNGLIFTKGIYIYIAGNSTEIRCEHILF